MSRRLSNTLFRIAAILLFSAITSPVRAESASGVWSSKFPTPPGANGIVYTMTTYGTNLIVAGEFTRIADIQARHIAKFDGQTWSEFGGGVELTNSSVVYCTAVDGTNLYIGGIFSKVGGVPANSIAKWAGDHWEALGDGLTGDTMFNSVPWVSALYLSGTNNLYAGGAFVKAGSTQAFHIGRWDGSQWHALDQGVYLPTDSHEPGTLPPGRVNAITGDGTNIYVGGMFLKAGGVNTTNLALWNGSAWQSIGSTSDGQSAWLWDGERISGIVNSLAFYDNHLFVVGDFSRIAGLAITNIARWQNGAWDTPLSVNGPISVGQIANNDLYITGNFDRAEDADNSIAAINVVKFHGDSLIAVDAPLADQERIYSLQNYNGSLYVGGWFGHIGAVSAGGIARLDDIGWHALSGRPSNSPHGRVNSIASDGTNIYAAGPFSLDGEGAVARVARWNGQSWSLLPPIATNVFPWRLAVIGPTLYVTSSSPDYQMGGPPITSWDGKNWTVVGIQADQPRWDNRLLVVQSNLFSSFTNGTQWWNGAEWHTIPWVTFNDFSERLGTDGANVYVARQGAGGIRVARWDGTNVFEYPLPPINMISCISAAGTNLLVDGWQANGNRETLLAWDGAAWIEWPGVAGFISNILGIGNKIVAAGSFGSIGGTSANSIAIWDGALWRTLDYGVFLRDKPGTIWSLAVAGRQLIVAGEFDRAGPNSAGNIAIWYQAEDVQLNLAPANPHQLTIAGGIGDRVQIESSDSLGNWDALSDLTFTAPVQTFIDSRPAPSSTNRFYRARILEP
jgi:hypothetical protein